MRCLFSPFFYVGKYSIDIFSDAFHFRILLSTASSIGWNSYSGTDRYTLFSNRGSIASRNNIYPAVSNRYASRSIVHKNLSISIDRYISALASYRNSRIGNLYSPHIELRNPASLRITSERIGGRTRSKRDKEKRQENIFHREDYIKE